MRFYLIVIISRLTGNRGEGRFDIELQPKSRGGHGYIIEFKACKEAELEKMAGSAVRQIQQKSYTANLEKLGVSGLACSELHSVVRK